MARSWRNFFRRSKKEDELQDQDPSPQPGEEYSGESPAAEGGVAVAEEEEVALETEVELETPSAEEPPVEEELEEDVELEEREELEAALTEDVDVEELPAAVARPEEIDEEFPRTISEGYAPEEPEAVEDDPEAQPGGWFGRLRKGLRRSRESLTGQFNAAIAEFRDVEDEEFWERVEEILISSDVGVPTTAKLVRELEQAALERNITSGKELRELLVEQTAKMLEGPVELDISHEPSVLLMVGVNGTGKTTTIGKLAKFLPGDVMFAAGDTFRAAAIEQLQSWGDTVGAPVVARQRGADAAAVAHESIERAKRENTDVLLIDTAGRLHTKVNLMSELSKVRRVIERQLPGAPHEVLMTVDATTGQNGLRQVKMFQEVAGVTGVILTKLDGTAKGGIALAIANETGLPIKLISVGEKVGDLHPFEAREFAEALFGDL